MARRSPAFTQADVTRLIKGALAAGVTLERIAGVKTTKEGPVLMFGAPGEASRGADKDALDTWRREHGSG